MGRGSRSVSPRRRHKTKKNKQHRSSRSNSREPRQGSRNTYKSRNNRGKRDSHERDRRSKDRKRHQEHARQKSQKTERKEVEKETHIKRDAAKRDEKISIIEPPKDMSLQDRVNKHIMRQFKARLMKLNEVLGSGNDEKSSSDDDGPRMVPPPIKAAETQQQVRQPKQNIWVSKWNKTASNQPILPVCDQQQSAQKEPQIQEKNLSLGPEASEELKLGDERSVEIEDQQEIVTNEEQPDALDEFMKDIEVQAAPQLQLPKKGGNIITFEEVVTTIPGKQQGQKEEQEFRKTFLEAISKLDQKKEQKDDTRRGVVMQNNEQKESDDSLCSGPEDSELDFFAKQRKMAERKELALVDHSKIKYPEVRFNLYREAEEIKNMDYKEVNKYRKEAGDIKARGKDILHPVFNWYQCGFNDRVLSVIEKRDYGKPFPIQAQCLPLLMSGRDVIGIAETGSGKTLAYLLPVLRHILNQKPVEEGEGPIAIIMTPTRELARQVYIEAKAFGKPLNIRVLSVYGGLSVQTQLSDFRKGAELVICTPGRMIDILTLNRGKITNLKRVTMLVIDEADRMFDLGFEPQITRIIDNLRPHKQVALFSATFPKNVEVLARRVLDNPVEVIVGSRGHACRNVEQIVQVREETTKFLRLLEILGLWYDKGSILIFVDKQTQVDFLYQELLKYGYDSLSLHGAMDPDDRQFTIYDFKKGLKSIMVATSVCARGLDIRSIRLVINFKCPDHLEDYIHRIGRTGRAGNKGTAITFITPAQQQYSIHLLKALQMAETHPPEDLIKLSQAYLGKVKKGQARRIRNKNMRGIGYKFDQEEEEKANQIKDMLKKQMKSEGLGGLDDSDDDDIELKKKKQEDIRGRNQQERIAEAIKNPQVKNKLLNEAVKAVSDAIKNGAATTTEKLLNIAVNSMKESVAKHKVVTTVDDGVEQVTKLVNQFQNKNGESADFFSYDFEINDYPQAARQKACNQQFLRNIQSQTNCTVSLRGVFVQPGKKVPVGCRKLYLHIQGENKYYVNTAYKQIKTLVEHVAFENMHMGHTGKFALCN